LIGAFSVLTGRDTIKHPGRSRQQLEYLRVGNFDPQATDPILANDADLREVAAGLAGGLARVVVGFSIPSLTAAHSTRMFSL
jgi:hypothetical protein